MTKRKNAKPQSLKPPVQLEDRELDKAAGGRKAGEGQKDFGPDIPPPPPPPPPPPKYGF